MRRMLLLAMLLPLAALDAAPAWAKAKKAKNADVADDTRIVVYDADHPRAPPTLLFSPVDEVVSTAPVLHIKMGREPEDIKTTERSVILDQFKFVPRPKGPKAAPKKPAEATDGP